jgi:DNA-directed RNA polymerase subunit N (RpoN/RPB10)
MSCLVIDINLHFVKVQVLVEKCDDNDHQLDKLTREKVSCRCLLQSHVEELCWGK